MLPWVRVPGCVLESGYHRMRSLSRNGLNVQVLQAPIHADEGAVVAVPEEIFPDLDEHRRC